MSPASQGALEVERYIGSCLISNARQGAHKQIVSKKQQQQQQQQETGTLRGKVPRGCYTGQQQQQQQQQQNYGNNGGEQQCQYGPGSWAGAPLISMTSSPRRCNQRSSPSLGQQQQQQPPCEQHQQQQGAGIGGGGHLHKSPLSRLTIHTQGAPLILAGRFHNRGKAHNGGGGGGAVTNGQLSSCNNASGNNYMHGNANALTTTTTTTAPTSFSSFSSSSSNVAIARCQQQPSRTSQRPVADSAKKHQQQSSNSKDCSTSAKEATGTNIANIDSLSIASDESSGSNNSENSLPRIIKPRKRRKKDRKPPNNVSTASSTDLAKHEDQQHPQQQQSQVNNLMGGSLPEQSSMGTLKVYGAGCYDQQQQQRYEGVPPPLPPHHHLLRNHRRPPMGGGREGGVYGGGGGCPRMQQSSMQQELADVRQRYAHRHVQVKVLDDNRNIVVAPARAVEAAAAGSMRGMPPKGYRHASATTNSSNNHHNPVHHPVPRYLHHEYNVEHHQHPHQGPPVAQQHQQHPAPMVIGGCEDPAARDASFGSCQCRYCDPSGLIWDVDQNGYSPFLTPPASSSSCSSSTTSSSSSADFCTGHYGGPMPLFLSRPANHNNHHHHRHHHHRLGGCQEQERLYEGGNVESNVVASRLRETGVVLRRSWSDPTSYFSDEITSVPSKDVGVIGDRGQSENGKRRTLWRGDTFGTPTGPLSSINGPGMMANGALPSPKGLEVSTEIVTSPNGHRDLEIKFYSPSPSAPILLEEDKSLFTEEFDDEEEDFSEIWSYHESKLQQDFRTLLQAEE